MALVNLSLLFGGLGIAVPIVLHLTMRRQPRRLVLPTVRFLKQRQESNQRQLQLRHWILLALRCLVLVAGAVALARPSVAAAAVGNWLVVGLLGGLGSLVALLALAMRVQQRGRAWTMSFAAAASILMAVAGWFAFQTVRGSSPRMLGDQEAPVAAAFAIDSSPRLQYQFENRARLAVAQEMATWLLEQLPDGSEIAVVDTRPNAPVFAQDRAAATRTLQRLETSGSAQPVTSTLEQALLWLERSSLARREVYVFTDLAQGAWPQDDAGSLRQRIEALPDVQLYVIDVGVAQPKNAGLGALRLSSEALPASGELELEVDVTTWGASGTRSVELQLEQPEAGKPLLQDGRVVVPNSVPRGRQDIELTEGTQRSVQFRLRGWSAGVQHGQVRLLGEDGLAADDVRYFTVAIEEARPILVVAPPDVVTRYLVEAVAPREFRQTGQARFSCREVAQSALAQQNLAEFATVCLLDPQPLTPDEWSQLHQYVSAGGSLAILLGHHAQPGGSFDDENAKTLLGGRITRQWRSTSGELALTPSNFDHPITREFRSIASTIPWDQFPVYRHWELDPIAPATRTVISFSNRRPAILETVVGQGRVVTMTTPLSDPARPRGRAAWNELPTAPDAWPFVMLADQLLNYLAGAHDARLNYLSGETAQLIHREGQDPDRYQLFTPESEIQEVTARGGRITLKANDAAGQYRLKGFRGGVVLRGFSVNLPPHATDLTRRPSEQLDEFLGRGRYQLAKTHAEIDRGIGEARVGREFYPLLLLALAGLIGLEQLLANRFYGARK